MNDRSRTEQTVLKRLDEANHEPVEPTFRRAVQIIHTLLKPLTHRDWRNQSKLPQTGGYVVVSNHISNVDPLALVQYLVFSGRWGRFLAKDSLFGVPVVGRVLRGAGQIPVRRNTRSAADALSSAIDAIHQGKVVVVYPEGTITNDPDLWPMAGRTGAARIAYATGCPVIPVAQWGAQDIMYGKKIGFPRLLPRKTFQLITGDPIELEPSGGGAVTSAMLVRATAQIMSTLTDLVAELRQTDRPSPTSGPPPPTSDRPHDPARSPDPHPEQGAAE